MPGIMYTPPPKPGSGGGEDDEDVMEIYEDDVIEELDLENLPASNTEQLLADMNEMDLENYDADGDALSLHDDAEEDDDSANLPPKDDAEVVFTKHTGSVFCVSVDPVSATMAVTGGEDDKAYVWKASDGEVLFECEGHKDSVTAATFSHDAQYVATGDMSGVLKVWSMAKKQEIWGFEVADLEWLQWHSAAPVLLAGTVDGDMWMWKIPSGDCKTFQGNGRSCSVGKVMPDGKRACAGYEDGTVKVWDLRTASALHTFSGRQSHQETVTCLACHQDNALVVTGSTDVTARLLNTTSGKVVATLDCATETQRPDQENSTEAVAFSNTMAVLATGTLVGSLAMWDVPTQKLRHQCMHDSGIVRVAWDACAPILYTCTLNGSCHLWDARSGKREASWLGHTEEVLDMDIAKNSSMLVTACGDKTARVFSLHTPDR